MQTIIRMSNKALQITSLVKSYQDEHNADELLFLIPQTYGNLNILDCSTTMYWNNKNGQGGSVPFTYITELYQETYLQTTVSLSNTFTQVSGEIELWLEIVNGLNVIVLKTNEIKIPIYEHSGSADAIPEGQLTIVDALNIQVQILDSKLQAVSNSIPTIEEIEALFIDEATV